MPKMKTKSGAKKRFKVTANGRVKVAQAGKRHGMIKRSNKFIRNARGTTVLSQARREDREAVPALRIRRDPEMPRVKGGPASIARHKKGHEGRQGLLRRPQSRTFRTATQAVDKAHWSTRPVTASGASATSVRCGSSGSTQPSARMTRT